MRTQEEIEARINDISRMDDIFGVQRCDLIEFLDFEHASKFLKEEFKKEEEWKMETSPAEKIKGYMPFAWKKANDCRGLSAVRSLDHMMAWLWLDNKDNLVKECKNSQGYGQPQLISICKEYNIDWKKFDQGGWNGQRMNC